MYTIKVNLIYFILITIISFATVDEYDEAPERYTIQCPVSQALKWMFSSE